MPYTITTWHNEDAVPIPVIPKPKDTRRAVATLEEARAAVNNALYRIEGEMDDPRPLAGFYAQADTLPESGGTIGPLPDGTVIEVRRRSWRDLSPYCRFHPDAEIGDDPIDPTPAEIIDAYNARKANR